MVGKGIKKYANEKGLTVKNGLAYGVYHGFMITLNEGSGWKALSVAVSFNDENSVKNILKRLVLLNENGYCLLEI